MRKTDVGSHGPPPPGHLSVKACHTLANHQIYFPRLCLCFLENRSHIYETCEKQRRCYFFVNVKRTELHLYIIGLLKQVIYVLGYPIVLTKNNILAVAIPSNFVPRTWIKERG